MISPRKLFKSIWRKLKEVFTGSPPSAEQIISEENTVLPKGIDAERQISTNQIAKQQVEKSISEFVGDQKTESRNEKGRKRYLELNELRADLEIFEEQKAALNVVESRIKPVNYPDLTSFEIRINHLRLLLGKSKLSEKGAAEFPTFNFAKSSIQLEKLLFEASTLSKYKRREGEKHKQEELYKGQLRQKLSTLETCINQNKLEEAKYILISLTKSIRPNYQKEAIRLARAKERLREKELRNLRKQQEDALRRQAEEAKRIKEIQDQKEEEKRLLREQLLAIQSKEEEKKTEKETKLKALLTRKFNWRDFQTVLQKNGVTRFYHFTDMQNLKSIRENDGLYSWHYADSNGIVINFPGGDVLSRDLDKRYGLQDYVRVSLCKDHPMQYRLQQRERKLALLEVSIEVAYYENTIFCNINATDSKHQKGKELKDLERIRFSATKRTFVRAVDPDFKHHQAEILIKTWVPISHLTNINNFV